MTRVGHPPILIIVRAAILLSLTIDAFLWSSVSSGIVKFPHQQIKDDFGFVTSSHAVSEVYFLDNLKGWMTLPKYSLLLETEDGGKTWAGMKSPEGMERLYFLNNNVGWALKTAHDSRSRRSLSWLLQTTDGGKNWISMAALPDVDKNGKIVDLAFVSENLGWGVGVGPYGSCSVLEFSSGGKSITPRGDIGTLIQGCTGIYASYGVGVWIYGGGSVLHSNDNGRTWEQPIDLKRFGTSVSAFNISSIFWEDTGTGWLVGQDPDAVILETEDVGRTWKVAYRPQDTGDFSGVSFWDARHGCAVSVFPVILFCTEDGGATWARRDVLPPAREHQAQFFTELVMMKSGLGWALRGGGYLYETLDGGHSWREKDPLAGMKYYPAFKR